MSRRTGERAGERKSGGAEAKRQNLNSRKPMPSEHETVVLKCDLAEHGLKAGDVGTVVHCYNGSSGLEVEFVAAEGRTIAVATLSASDVRPMANDEIPHVREIASS